MAVTGVFILLAFAVARGTRLVTTDRIGLSFRRWVITRYGTESSWSYLIVCCWCTSIWLAAPASIIWAMSTLPLQWWWLALPGWFAMSYFVGLVNQLEER